MFDGGDWPTPEGEGAEPARLEGEVAEIAHAAGEIGLLLCRCAYEEARRMLAGGEDPAMIRHRLVMAQPDMVYIDDDDLAALSDAIEDAIAGRPFHPGRRS
jgi:hypothetical protein